MHMNYPYNKNENRLKKKIVVEKPSKREGASIQGIVKNQLEVV